MLEPVAGDARQPVVGVERVDVADGQQVGAHAVGELVDDVGQLLLGEVSGSRLDVDDPEPGLDLDELGRGVVPPAREHVGGDAGLGQGGHQLADVDVHAPAVALPGWASGDVCSERTARRRMMGTAGGQRSASTSSSSPGPVGPSFSWRNDL